MNNSNQHLTGASTRHLVLSSSEMIYKSQKRFFFSGEYLRITLPETDISKVTLRAVILNAIKFNMYHKKWSLIFILFPSGVCDVTHI